MENVKEKLLNTPIDQLDLSQDCIANLRKMQVRKLQDIIDKGWHGLRESQAFNYISFNEVVKLLADNGIVHLMEKSS
jgi:DNA-directed RNA polymerase alpha subunit